MCQMHDARAGTATPEADVLPARSGFVFTARRIADIFAPS